MQVDIFKADCVLMKSFYAWSACICGTATYCTLPQCYVHCIVNCFCGKINFCMMFPSMISLYTIVSYWPCLVLSSNLIF